ncbi:hypothetical protein EJ03DRAFT_324640 [Teratosphaeria nubilosa]|uniref:Uncharacterized protein n=1 Tax=Teratosphaeria nubilosa TaxID=161662 RepID=A0A6G1LJ99_9PEZI|nr:hypothetical protein EJ03DRAFT_324640 [Teratosphaeria nubilosa]
MALATALPLETHTTIIRDLLNNSKEDRAVTKEAVEFFAALELIHPGAEAIRCYGLRRKVQRDGQTRCAGLLNTPILAAKLIQLWGILRDPDIQGHRLREELFALGPAFHCTSHATASDHGRFAQRCLNVCLRFRCKFGIDIILGSTPPTVPPDYTPPALLPYEDQVQALTSSPASTVASPTPPSSPEDGDAALVQAAFEEMLYVQQSPKQASTAAWMQALHVADHILKRAGVTVHTPMLLEAVAKVEQGTTFAQLGPLEQSTLLFALRRAKGCFEHGI